MRCLLASLIVIASASALAQEPGRPATDQPANRIDVRTLRRGPVLSRCAERTVDDHAELRHRPTDSSGAAAAA